MKNYSLLSDFEINRLVAEGLGLSVDHSAKVILPQIYCGNDEDGCRFGWVIRDFCNNPADAWPIILGHKLSLINADDEWLCVPDDTAVDGITGDEVQMIYSSNGHVHANPLRAAMIVFLMMKDAEK